MPTVGNIFWSGGEEYTFYPSYFDGKYFNLVRWDNERNIYMAVDGAANLTLPEAERIQKLMKDNY